MAPITAAFAQVAAQARPPEWQRPLFGRTRLRRDSERVFHERDLLRRIFRLAQGSAVASAALDWARAHRIRFMIDYKTTFGGYYMPGAGVVAIARGVAEGQRGLYGAVDVLTHELRHAWQDHHGLIPRNEAALKSNFPGSLIRQGLIEADAYAHGRLAAAQCAGEVGRARDYLRYHFREWYAGGAAEIYGAAKRQLTGYRMAISGCTKPYEHIEAVTGSAGSATDGIDPWSRTDIEKLGKRFEGRNYLATWDDDRLWRRILSPAMAMQMFSEMSRADAVAEAIRVRQTRYRLVSTDPQYRQRLNAEHRAVARLKLPR